MDMHRCNKLIVNSQESRSHENPFSDNIMTFALTDTVVEITIVRNKTYECLCLTLIHLICRERRKQGQINRPQISLKNPSEETIKMVNEIGDD
jgi:hypothetical protein